ncbi:MAG: autotransporter-associated beta strand repeat-containing protein [Cyclobacteriaceae bacterium]|nr:autotransporter-associated beta strand repeat-containing protein [Cyclobacteriaceae bacterium]
MPLTLRLLSRFKSSSAVESVSIIHPGSTRFLLVFLILTISINAFAQKTWLPATGGDWSVGANWSGGTPPVAGDVVIINSDQSGNITNVPTISLGGLTVSGNALFGSTAAATVAVVTVTGPLTITAGKTLTLGIDGSGFRVNMILSATSVSTIAGTLNVTSGTVNRFLQNDGDLTITGTGLVRDNFSVTGFDSDFILGSGAILRIGSTVGITTSPTATGNIQVTGVRTFSTTADYAYVGAANQVTGNGLPATVNDLIIANTGGGGNNTVTLSSNVSISNALFVNTGVFALGTNNVNTVASVNMSGTSITGTGTLNLAGDVITNISATTASIAAPVALGASNRTLTIADGAANPDLIISSVISGTGALTKNGAGTITISASNTFTGGVTLNTGTINANNSTCFGTSAGTITINGGSLSNTTAGAITLTNYPQTWNGDFSYFGTQNLDMGTGSITLTDNRNVSVLSSTLGINGVVSGSFGINKSGGGVLVLGGNNTFTGGLGIDAGRVTLANAGALNAGSPNAVSFGTGSTGSLRLNGLSVTISGLNSSGGSPIVENAGASTATLTVNTSGVNNFAGLLQNLGPALSLSKSGTGNLALSGNNTYTGGTTLSAGTLAINSATAIGTGALTINGGTLDNTSAGSITLSTNNTQNWNGNFAFAGTQSLNLGTGAVTPNANRQITVNASELTVGGVIGGGAIGITKLGAGTLTLSGANTYTGGFTLNAGTLNINNSNALGATGTFTINGGTIGNTTGGALTTANYPMTWGGDFAFTGIQNLNLGTGTITLTGNRQVTVNSNVLTVGGLLNAPALNLSKAGAGTLSLGANDVTINGLTVSNGTFNSTSATLFIAGSFVNSGTFNHNSGTVHYNGGSPQLVAAVTYNQLISSGAGQKNAAGAITVNNNLTNSTIFDMGANSLMVGGVIDNTGGNLRFTGAANGIAVNSGTVTYYGASQTIGSGSYNNLVINQAAGQASLGGAVTVNGILTLTNGNLNLNGFDLTLGASASISVASPSASRMIIANGSQVVKTFSGVGSFLFPIGDNTGTTEYSPITINITAGSGFPANVGVTVIDAKHPNNASTSNFLTRYWEVDQTAITGCVATITATYPGSDISGAEANIHAAQLPGTFNQTTNPWIKYAALAANTLTATGATLISGTNAFTGIRGADPVATIVGGGGTICVGGSVALNTSTTGDGPFTYSWSPATGLSATNIANPVASPVTTETYTVTIRDANGIVDTDVTTITVTPIPATPVVTPAGPVVVCEGSANITLTSDAASGNQWYKDGVLIAGATATTYNITTAPGNSGSYTVISTITGCASTVSNAVAVTINALPLTTPVVTPATTTICSGNTVTVNIAGSQAGINYELFDGVTSLSSPVAGTGGSINLITSALTSNTTITVRATNPTTTCTTLLSGTSVVTVTPIPATPVVTPAGPVVVCEGSANITLTSDAVSGNQWYKDGVLIAGATATTLNITTNPSNSGSYTVISTITGCASAVSNAVAVTINALPLTTPVVTPATTTICSGNTVTVNIAGSQAGINYELIDGVTSLSSPVAGTGGSINLITSALTSNTTITVRATNPVTTCTTLLTGTTVVTVNAIPATPTITPAGPVVVCEGSANITLTSDAASGNQWYKDGVLIAVATATTLNITTNPSNSGSYTVISTITGCASVVSNAVAVTINALPLTTPVVTPATTTICSGNTVTVNIAGSQAGINYELFDGVTSLSSPVAGTGGSINLITSALTSNTTITVRATNPTTTCTTLLSGTSVVTVTPIPATPVVTPAGPVVVCEGSANITLTSDAVSGNQWYKDGVLIAGATATTLNITTNPSNSGSYTVISTITGCASAVSNAVAVTINALPLTTPVVTPATTTICSGNTVTVNIAGSQAGINYELIDGVTSLSSPVAGTGGSINLITSALTSNTTITVRATNPVTTCTTLLTGTTVVTVNAIPATPTITPAGPVVVCEGSANITLTSDAASGNQWYKDGVLIAVATATTLNITTNPSNSGSYTVISTITGCASVVSNAVAVTINALPLTTPVVTPATTTICSGNTVTVNIAGSQAGINYELFDGVTSLSSPVAGTGGSINLITSALTSNTTITVRATNPTTTCTTLLSGTSVVTVTPIPATPVVTPAGPVVVCEGSANITLTSDAVSGNQWYKDGVLIAGATATTLNITTNPSNSGSYTVISTITGCASAVSNAVAVTINALPSNTPGVSPVNATICSGSNVTVTIIGTEPGINYRLLDGVTPVSAYVAGTGAAINLVSSALTANTTLTVEAQNPVTGCSIILPGTTIVTVGATIPTPVISPVSPVTACVGDPSVVLTSSAVSGNQWYKDGIPIPGEVNQTLSISTAVVNSGSYTVYEIQAGCTSAASVPVNVTINSIASPPVASNPNPICVGQAIPTLTAAGSNLNWYSDAALTTLVGTGSPFTPSATEVDNLTAGSYLLYVTQTIGCESPATTVTVIVNPAVVANAGVDTNLCNGQSITLGGSPSATGGNGTYTYSWTSVPPGFNSTQSNPVVTPALGVTTYVLQVTDAFGCTDSDQIDVTVNEIPVFTVTNNTSGGTGQICSGSTIDIDLASPIVGAIITLQPVVYGAFITGGLYAAGGTFLNGNTVTEGGGLINNSNAPVSIVYTFSVATPDCANPVTQQAVIVVNPSPALTITNSSPSICSGSAVNVLLNSATSGAVIRITSVNYGSVTGGTLSAGSTFTPGSSITESLTNTGNNPVTVRYNLEVVANGCTTSGFFTDVVVNPNPTFVATNFAPQICHGDQTSIFFGSVTAGHQINVVNVFYGAVTGGTVNPGVTTFTSATPLQEALFNNTNAPIDVEYTFNVTTPATTPVCPIAPVNQVVTVRVYPNPTFTVTNNSGGGTGIICSGQQSSVLLNTPISGGQVRLASVSYGAVVGSYAAGALFANGQTLSETLINNTAAPITVDYEFEAIVSSCTASAPQVVSVTVNPTPNVVALPASQTICSGANTSIALSTTNGVAGATYSWTVVQSGVSGATASSGANINQTLTATGSTAGTATYTITPAAGGCNGTPVTVIVTVNPLPDVVAALNAETICSGATTNINLSTTNGVVGATYSWTVVQSNVSGATAGFGTSINQTLTATTSSSGTATYTITPTSNGCSGTPIVVVVTVNPSPNVVALPASQTICSGANTSIALSTTNGVGGATYSWTVVQSGVSGATASSGANINQTLTATGSTAGTATYTITPTAGGCNGTPITVIVTVNPLPDVVAAPNAETICSGATTNINLSTTNGVVGATYSWTVVQSNVSGATAGFGTAINQTLTTTTSSSGTATYTITPTSNGCSGTPIVVVVTVNPASVTTSSPLTDTRCSGAGPLNFTPTFNVAGTTYTWTSSISGTITPATVSANGTSTIMDNPVNIGSSPGTVTYTFIPTAPGGCIGAAFNYVVTVNPEPVGVNDVKTVCSDESIGYNLLLNVASLGNNVGSTFSWVATDNANPLVTGESTSAFNGAVITDIITNLSNTDQVVVYTVTPTGANGCAGAIFQITVTVKPEPVGISTTAADICSGSSVAYDLQNNVNVLGNALAANFTWTANAQPNVTGETTALRSGSVIDDVLINTSAVNQVVVYTVTPTSQAGACLGNSFTITANVNPKAIFTAGPDLAVCVDRNDIEIQGLVTFAPSTYSWSGGTFNNNTLEKPRYILSAADKAVTVPTVRVLTLTTAASGVCPSESETMNLTLNPLPNASFIGLPTSTPENGPDLKLNAFQAGGLFTIVPGSGLTATSIDGGTGFDQAFLTPANATIYDGTPATENIITYSFTDINGCSNATSQNLRVNPLTNVNFVIQNSITDSDGDFRICADNGDLLLTPIDGGNPGIPPTFFESLSSGITVLFDGTNYTLRTDGVASGIYIIKFTYTNSLGVTSGVERNVKVQASPVVSFTSTGTCIDSPTIFTNTSTINTTSIGSPTISLVEWNFGDFSGVTGAPAATIPIGTNAGRTTGTYDNPSHTYGNASSYTVSLKVTTSQGCANTFTNSTPVIVGTIPLVDFDYFAICNNDSTRFKALISNLGSSTIAQYNWNFDDGDLLSGLGVISPPANSGRTIGTYVEPVHKYINTGGYNPTLTVTTNLGCTSIPRTRPITIVPYVTVVATSGNPPEDFDTQAGWFIENLINPDDNSLVSWKHGSPTGALITAGNSAGNVWWSGNNANSYFANEKSAVNSPCFDLDNLERPMFALDYFSDLEANLDGVVLQYSINGGATWELVGPAVTETRDQGINWFNGAAIPSNPGNQTLGQYGWTNKQGSWKNARFNLDMIPKVGEERKQVRFRLAFASNGTNAPGITYDGFAFDNVYVGEKQRNVLVEHFTTSQLSISVTADNYLNGLYNSQLLDRGFSDFDQIQYHVNFNGVDPLNRDNPVDPAARALRYRVSQPPYTIMDGKLEPGKFTGIYTEINKIELDRRALIDPAFDLQLTDLPSADNTTISVRLTLTARQAYTRPVLVNVALLEKDVNGNKNVLRKNLFTPAGRLIELPFAALEQRNVEQLNVVLDVPIVNPNGLMLVGYVQDVQTNEILQSVVMRNGVAPKQTDPVTAADDTPAKATLSAITIFPNPASLEFNFGLPTDVAPGTTWRIIDQRGVSVLAGDFEGVVNGIKPVDISELANAVYYVVLTSPQGAAVHKKLVVVNRN